MEESNDIHQLYKLKQVNEVSYHRRPAGFINPIAWEKPVVRLKNWMEHMDGVFKIKWRVISFKLREGGPPVDLEDMRTVFGNFNYLSVDRCYQANFEYTALRAFNSNSIWLIGVIESLKIYEQIMLCPLTHVRLTNWKNGDDGKVELSLDTLLGMNSRSISLFNVVWREKTINRFLKLWVKGCNSNLFRVSLRFVRNVNVEAILRGIQNTPLPIIDDLRVEKYEIRNNNGMLGIISLERIARDPHEGYRIIDFIVYGLDRGIPQERIG